MRAAIFEKPGQPWVIRDLPEPEPGASGLVIKVGRCGICGSDLHMTEEGAPPIYPHGCVPGHEFAGEVVALGKDVSDFKIGDRIAAMSFLGCGTCEMCRSGQGSLCLNGVQMISGGFAEYARVPAVSAVRLPQSLSISDGALVEPLAVGLHAVNLANPNSDTRAVVVGAGSIGLTVVHYLRSRGVRHITAVARSTRREDIARHMGASEFIALQSDNHAGALAAAKNSADVVFECVGVVGALDSCIEFLRPNGLVVSCGICPYPESLFLFGATAKQARMVFSAGFTAPEFQHCTDQLDAGKVEPREMISAVVSLDDLPAKIEAMRHNSTDTKVQVEF